MKPRRNKDKTSTIELPMSQFSAHCPVLSMIVEDIFASELRTLVRQRLQIKPDEAKITGGASHVTAGKSAKAIARRRLNTNMSS